MLQGRSFRAALVVASCALFSSAHAAAEATGKELDQESVEAPVVVVTAQKTLERLQDVPIPVTVIDAGTLVASNKTRLQDYFSDVPGLSFISGGDQMMLAIRGVTTGNTTNPTVGMTIDDVPFGSSTQTGGALFTPELDPSDMARVEVLRGPQGTLYGASSIGGLLRYVTVDPATDRVRAELQTGLDGIKNGHELGYNAGGSVNVPLNDTLAIRASGFTRRDPGYIDNPVLELRGLNSSRTTGGHLAGLWAPTDSFSLKLSALYQKYDHDGADVVELQPGLADLQQDQVATSGPHNWTFQGYSAVLRYKIGEAELTSVTGWSRKRVSGSDDYTNAMAFFSDTLTEDAFGVPNGTTAGILAFTTTSSKLSQELRLTTPLGKHFDLLAGVFYTHETSFQDQEVLAAVPTTGQIEGLWLHNYWNAPYIESAVFADLTVHFTDRLDVQIGGRESQLKESYYENDTGSVFYTGSTDPIIVSSSSRANAFTYLLTPRLKFSDDLMTYVRIASGYRPGGPNAGASIFGLPQTYDPDKTQNYEVGVKGDGLEHRLSFDASLYYIDWKHIQLPETNPVFYPYFLNGSRARSQGLELSAQARPGAGLSISGWVAFNDAKLTEGLPAGTGTSAASGARLPFSSRFSANLSVDEEFPLGAHVTGVVGASASYVGERDSDFTAEGTPRQIFPAYTTADLRAGARFERWMLNLVATNVADRRGIIFSTLTTSADSFTFIQPRRVGLNISTSF